MYRLKVTSAFEAAHRLPEYPGKCHRLHGHNWRVETTIVGYELDNQGMLADFKIVKKALNDILNAWDHQYLNDLPDFQTVPPTAENMSRLVYEKLAASNIFNDRVKLKETCVWESTNSCALYSID